MRVARSPLRRERARPRPPSEGRSSIPPSHLCRRRSSPSRVILLVERLDRVVPDADPEPGRDRLEEGLRKRIAAVGELGELIHRDRASVHTLFQHGHVRARRNDEGVRARALVDDVVVVRNVTRACVLEGRLVRRLAREQPRWIEAQLEGRTLALERPEVPVLDDSRGGPTPLFAVSETVTVFVTVLVLPHPVVTDKAVTAARPSRRRPVCFTASV